MKKLLVIFMVALLLLSLSSVGLAKQQHKNLLLNRIVIIDEEPLSAAITIRNDRMDDFEDGKVSITIQELGIRTTKRFHLKSDKRDTIRLFLDTTDVQAGEYYIRIVVENDDVKRVRHRIITIE